MVLNGVELNGAPLNGSLADDVVAPSIVETTASIRCPSSVFIAPAVLHCSSSDTYIEGVTNVRKNAHHWWTFTDGSGNKIRRYPESAHLYRRPGTWSVRVDVETRTQHATVTKDVVVQDPDTVYAGTNTVVVSPTANWEGAPAGARRVQSSNVSQVFEDWLDPGVRILFRRGEMFSATGSYTMGGGWTALAQVGAFGSGTDRANIVCNSQSEATVRTGPHRCTNGITFYDLNLIYQSGTQYFFQAEHEVQNLAFINLRNTGNWAIAPYLVNPDAPYNARVNGETATELHSRIAWVDCEIDTNGKNDEIVVYVGAKWLAFLNTKITARGASTGAVQLTHALRINGFMDGVVDQDCEIIYDDTATTPVNSRHCIKLHNAAPRLAAADAYAPSWYDWSERFTIACNESYNGMSFANTIGTQGQAPANADEWVRHVIVDGGNIRLQGPARTGVHLSSEETLIRNVQFIGEGCTNTELNAVGFSDYAHQAKDCAMRSCGLYVDEASADTCVAHLCETDGNATGCEVTDSIIHSGNDNIVTAERLDNGGSVTLANNVNEDPFYIDAENDNFELATGSPAAAAGAPRDDVLSEKGSVFLIRHETTPSAGPLERAKFPTGTIECTIVNTGNIRKSAREPIDVVIPWASTNFDPGLARFISDDNTITGDVVLGPKHTKDSRWATIWNVPLNGNQDIPGVIDLDQSAPALVDDWSPLEVPTSAPLPSQGATEPSVNDNTVWLHTGVGPDGIVKPVDYTLYETSSTRNIWQAYYRTNKAHVGENQFATNLFIVTYPGRARIEFYWIAMFSDQEPEAVISSGPWQMSVPDTWLLTVDDLVSRGGDQNGNNVSGRYVIDLHPQILEHGDGQAVMWTGAFMNPANVSSEELTDFGARRRGRTFAICGGKDWRDKYGVINFVPPLPDELAGSDQGWDAARRAYNRFIADLSSRSTTATLWGPRAPYKRELTTVPKAAGFQWDFAHTGKAWAALSVRKGNPYYLHAALWAFSWGVGRPIWNRRTATDPAPENSPVKHGDYPVGNLDPETRTNYALRSEATHSSTAQSPERRGKTTTRRTFGGFLGRDLQHYSSNNTFALHFFGGNPVTRMAIDQGIENFLLERHRDQTKTEHLPDAIRSGRIEKAMVFAYLATEDERILDRLLYRFQDAEGAPYSWFYNNVRQSNGEFAPVWSFNGGHVWWQCWENFCSGYQYVWMLFDKLRHPARQMMLDFVYYQYVARFMRGFYFWEIPSGPYALSGAEGDDESVELQGAGEVEFGPTAARWWPVKELKFVSSTEPWELPPPSFYTNIWHPTSNPSGTATYSTTEDHWILGECRLGLKALEAKLASLEPNTNEARRCRTVIVRAQTVINQLHHEQWVGRSFRAHELDDPSPDMIWTTDYLLASNGDLDGTPSNASLETMVTSIKLAGKKSLAATEAKMDMDGPDGTLLLRGVQLAGTASSMDVVAFESEEGSSLRLVGPVPLAGTSSTTDLEVPISDEFGNTRELNLVGNVQLSGTVSSADAIKQNTSLFLVDNTRLRGTDSMMDVVTANGSIRTVGPRTLAAGTLSTIDAYKANDTLNLIGPIRFGTPSLLDAIKSNGSIFLAGAGALRGHEAIADMEAGGGTLAVVGPRVLTGTPSPLDAIKENASLFLASAGRLRGAASAMEVSGALGGTTLNLVGNIALAGTRATADLVNERGKIFLVGTGLLRGAAAVVEMVPSPGQLNLVGVVALGGGVAALDAIKSMGGLFLAGAGALRGSAAAMETAGPGGQLSVVGVRALAGAQSTIELEADGTLATGGPVLLVASTASCDMEGPDGVFHLVPLGLVGTAAILDAVPAPGYLHREGKVYLGGGIGIIDVLNSMGSIDKVGTVQLTGGASAADVSKGNGRIVLGTHLRARPPEAELESGDGTLLLGASLGISGTAPVAELTATGSSIKTIGVLNKPSIRNLKGRLRTEIALRGLMP